MNKRKVAALLLAGLTAVGSFGATSVMATPGETGTGTTPVRFENTPVIHMSEYDVTYPGVTTFNPSTLSKSMNLTMVPKSGGSALSATVEAEVKVRSANSYTLTATGLTAVPYSLTYGAVTPTGSGDTVIGVIGRGSGATGLTLSGTASITAANAAAAATGIYDDTLTYTVKTLND